MANCPLTLRITKGSKLTFAELDGNFISLANCISSLPQYDSFVTGGTYNISTNSVDFTGNFDFIPFSTDLSYLANMDITVTGGTYDSSTGTVTFYNNSGGTFQVSGFLTGYTNYYTTGVTLNSTTLEFDRTDLSNAYSVDLSSLLFTGNTSASCITDLYVSNLYGCSPITIHDNLVIESGVTITSTNGGGQIELDYALQPSNILISTDNGGVTEAFINLQPTDLNLSSLNGDVRIQSLNSNNFRSGNLFSNRSQILMEPDFVKIGVEDPSAVFSNDYESVVVYNTLSSDQATSNADKWPVTVSSKNSTILSGVRNSVILGGSDITASTNNTVYVDNLNINTVGNGTSVINLGLDSNGYVVTGITSNSGIFGISNSGGVYTYYSTLSSAMSAATTGQTIEMFADVTETGNVTIVWKDGVNFNGNGHTYTHSYAAGNSNTINIPTTTVTCNIFNWKVIRTGRANGTTGDYAFYVVPGGFQANASVIKFTGVYIESTYGYSVNFDGQGGAYSGTLYSKAYLNAITSYNNILDGLYGESTSSGWGLANDSNGTTNCTGKSVSGQGLYSNNARNCTGISISGIGLGQGTNGTGPYYNCVGMSTSGAGGAVASFFNCSLISTSGIAGDSVGGSNNTLISSSNNAWYTFFPGYKITNSLLVSVSNSAARTRGSIIKNCVVRSEYNNAAGRAISEWFNDNVSKIINSDLEVANTSANCIYSESGSLNMKIAGCSYDGATTPVAANITQALINTEDNQGNILL
jgi:hypothetical protein